MISIVSGLVVVAAEYYVGARPQAKLCCTEGWEEARLQAELWSAEVQGATLQVKPGMIEGWGREAAGPARGERATKLKFVLI